MSVQASTWAWAQDVKSADKLVLLAIANEVRSDGRTSYPGHKLIADRCGKTPRAVQDSIRRLEEGGLLKRERRFRPNGSRTSDLYVLPLPEETSAGRKSPPEAERSHHRKPTSYPYRGEEPGDNSSSKEEQGIFDYWVQAFDKDRARLTPKRRQKIRMRLRSYPASDLLRAIDGCAASEFHRTKGHTDLELILRSDDKLEWFRDKAPKEEPEPELTMQPPDDPEERRRFIKALPKG